MNIVFIVKLVVILVMTLSVLSTIVKSISKSKIHREILKTLDIITTIVMAIAFGIVIPYVFLSFVFQGATGFVLMIITAFVVWMLISLLIQFRNRLIILTNNSKEIYVRDIEVNYSPAIVSYLMNNKIETKKDLVATLLNLCIEKVLEIKKDEDGKIRIIDLKNEKRVEELSSDEKYAYEMITTGVTTSKIANWKHLIEVEYYKYKFSKIHKADLRFYLFFIYAILIMGSIIYLSISGEHNAINIFNIVLITFMAAWEMSIFKMIKEKIKKNKATEFIDTYTIKGAREYNKWKKFEKFIGTFTLIKDKEYGSIMIWGRYLSYSIALGINQKCDNDLYKEIMREYSFDYKEMLELFYE